MTGILAAIFGPKLNRLVLIGGVITVVGLVLTPILVGIPILALGTGLLSLGLLESIVCVFPGGRKLVGYYRDLFMQMKNFVLSLIKEVFKRHRI